MPWCRINMAARQCCQQFVVQMAACRRMHRDIPPGRSGRITAGVGTRFRERSAVTHIGTGRVRCQSGSGLSDAGEDTPEKPVCRCAATLSACMVNGPEKLFLSAGRQTAESLSDTALFPGVFPQPRRRFFRSVLGSRPGIVFGG